MTIIHQRPTYRVYVEAGHGKAMAHVAELPGCFAFGSDSASAVGNTPRAIRDFLLWLRSHKERLVPEAHVSRPSMADLYVTEVRPDGENPTIFPFDEKAWNDEKLERTLRWLSYSRLDLLAAVDGLSDSDMRSHTVKPDRTVYGILKHIADAEYGYINGIAGPLDNSLPQPILERLEAVREILLHQARAVPLHMRGEAIYPTWSERPEEPWTLSKALRRALEHEREHVEELKSL